MEFEQIFTDHYRSVYYFFARQGVAEQDRQDLTQETFLRVFRSRRRFRGEITARRWILIIAMNVWRNELRNRTTLKRAGVEVPIEEMVEKDCDGEACIELPDQSPSSRPFEHVAGVEQAERLSEALLELPAQMRRCIQLRFSQELSYREIATTMQISIETVKSQIHQARQRLRIEVGHG